MGDVERSRGLDADEVLRVCKITLEVLRSSGGSAQKPIELLEVLYERTEHYLKQGISIDDAQFTAAELNAKIKGKEEREDSDEVARRYINNNLAKLEALLQDQRNSIDQSLRAAALNHRLDINKINSEGRRKAHVYLDLELIDQAQPEQPLKIPAHFVQYRVQHLMKPPFWAKPFERFSMIGLPLWIYMSGLLLATCAILFLIFSGVYLRPLFWSIALLLAVIGWPVWMTFGPFYLILERGVAIAPGWLLGWHEDYGQIELRPTEQKRANGKFIREVRLVRYQADCPICKAEIDIRRGRREFAGRLIGVCREAGTEHRFSFDHISKIGVPLRSNSYYGQTS